MSPSNWIVVPAFYFFAGAFLYIDIATDMGVGAGLPYLVVIMAYYAFARVSGIRFFALIITVFIGIGYYEAYVTEANRIELLNRIVLVAIIWGAVALLRSLYFKSARAEELSNIVRSSSDAIVTEDLDGRILTWNKGAEQIYGYTFEEVVGKSIEAFVPKDRLYETTFFIETAKAGKTIENFETVRNTKDGRIINVSNSVTPVFDSNGKLEAISVISRDITERVDYEKVLKQGRREALSLLEDMEASREALKEREHKFRTALEASPSAIIIVGDDGMITLANAKAQSLFLYSESELIGMSVEELVPKRVKGRHPHLRADFLKDPRAMRMGKKNKVSCIRKNGTEFPAEIGLTPFQTSEGVFVISSITDISDYKIAQDQLERANQSLRDKNAELEQFNYITSHDLQTPLRHVSSYTQLLLEKHGDSLDDESKLWMNYVLTGTRRMSDLIKDLLSLTRVQRSGADNWKQVDLNAVASDVVEDLRESGTTTFRIEDLPKVKGNITQIRQLMQNLMSNAVKFRKKEMPVNVNVFCISRQNDWEIIVKDNGIGIDMKQSDKIFGVFKRLHASSQYEGNGIGLSICQKVVEIHGGRIWVDSEPGIGSEFHFTIPKY